MQYTPPSGGINQLTGDATAGPGTGSQVLTLTPVGTAGTIGDGSHYPVVTTDAKGRVTGMTSTPVPPSGQSVMGIYESTLPISDLWSDVAFGNNTFVAIAKSNSSAYSTDNGRTWTFSALPSSSTWQSITFGNGTFVAVSLANEVAYSTNNGQTWTQVAGVSGLNNWVNIAFGNNTFVAVSENTTQYYMYSTTNGATWIQGTFPGLANLWSCIAFGNGVFVALAQGTTIAAYSTDGITWTTSGLPNSWHWRSIGFGNGLFIAPANNNNSYAVSSDNGVTWNSISFSSLLTQNGGNAIIYGNNTFVNIGYNIYTSPDNGNSWAPAKVISPLHNGFGYFGGAYGNNTFVFVGNINGVTTSNIGFYSAAIGFLPEAYSLYETMTPTSGTMFIPCAYADSHITFQINAAAAGSYTITMGGSNGAGYTVASAVAMTAGNDATVTIFVPANWPVVITLTTVTLASTLVISS